MKTKEVEKTREMLEKEKTKEILKEWFDEVKNYPQEIKVLLVKNLFTRNPEIAKTEEFLIFASYNLDMVDVWENEKTRKLLELFDKSELIAWRVKEYGK